MLGWFPKRSMGETTVGITFKTVSRFDMGSRSIWSKLWTSGTRNTRRLEGL